jgi:hypothetical protein
MTDVDRKRLHRAIMVERVVYQSSTEFDKAAFGAIPATG